MSELLELAAMKRCNQCFYAYNYLDLPKCPVCAAREVKTNENDVKTQF